jgi:hypothetical protein
MQKGKPIGFVGSLVTEFYSFIRSNEYYITCFTPICFLPGQLDISLVPSFYSPLHTASPTSPFQSPKSSYLYFTLYHLMSRIYIRPT